MERKKLKEDEKKKKSYSLHKEPIGPHPNLILSHNAKQRAEGLSKI